MALLVKHVIRHPSGRVSFRRAYPPELLPFIPGKTDQKWAELKVSLGAKDAAGFLSRYEAAANKYDAIVIAARRRQTGAFDQLDSPTIAYLAEAYRFERLQEDEAARWDPEERLVTASVAEDLRARGIEYRAPWKGNTSRRWSMKARETLEASMAEYRRLRAEGDLDGLVEEWRDEALDLAEAQGLIVDPSDTAGLLRLCRALNDAAISAGEDRARRLDGEDVPTPEEPPRLAGATAPQRGRGPQSGRVPLLALYDAYSTANDRGMTAGVRIEWRAYIERLIAFLGHDDASQVTADDLRNWRDQLLSEVTKRGTLRSPVTVRDKYIMAVSVTFNYGVDEGRLKENVAKAVKVRQQKKIKLRERAFTMDEAKAILSASLLPAPAKMSPEHARARRWVPWLCAYSGARVGEMAQLRGEDIQEKGGIWFLHITPIAGSVKNREARIVPLHAHLIEQGFLDVVRAIGAGPLFYDPARQRVEGEGNRHIKKVGERIANWVRNDVGITDPDLQPNHGWRHLFKARSYEAEVEERMADALQGHAPLTTGRNYGPPEAPARAAAINKFPRFEVE